MSDNSSSHVQQATGLFTKAIAEQLGRTEAAFAEYGRMEEKAMEQVRVGIDESARLSKETFAYATALMTYWRKFSLDAAKRASEMVTPAPTASVG